MDKSKKHPVKKKPGDQNTYFGEFQIDYVAITNPLLQINSKCSSAERT